jgi:VWFA-related protein
MERKGDMQIGHLVDTSPFGGSWETKLQPVARIFILLAATICLACWPLSFATAQEDPIANFEGLAEVKEVLLDVIAVDDRGRIVIGLGKDDFVIHENGMKVEITGVSFYTTRYGLDGLDQEIPGSIPSSRYFVFFFHDRIGGGSIGDYLVRQQAKARRGSLNWVEEHMLPSDWVAVASYDVRLKLHQDFTQDRFAIAEGIHNATTRKDPEKGMGRRGRILPPLGTPSLLRSLPEGKALNKQSRNLYNSLRLLAEASAYIVGRKNLLLFSVGFGEIDSNGLSSAANHRHYPPMEQALNNRNVAVYPIDLTPFKVRHLQGQILKRLALGTGGHYFRDPINFLTPILRISEENIGYYLISYQSEHSATKAGYQEVEIRAHNRSIRLKSRKGYRFGKK